MTEPWRNPSNWHTWTNRVIEGTEYTFDHLLPFTLKIHRPATDRFPNELNVSVDVVFDCHVVTTTPQGLERNSKAVPKGNATWIDAGRNVRLFDIERYQRSFDLVNFLKTLPNGKTPCYSQAKTGNYLVWQPLANSKSHYQVFFDLYHARRDDSSLVMYVQSAFVRDMPREEDRKNRKVFVQVCATLAT